MADEPQHSPDDLDPRLEQALAEALTPVSPDAAARARMRGRIMQHVGQPETEIVRADSGEWRPLLPGIRIKNLRLDRDQGTQTSLWELAPGSRIPGHSHIQEEECLVLEGSISMGDETFNAGDYLYARKGVEQAEFFTATGALLLIRSELVPETSRLTRFLYGLFKS
ncbi:anti-sigma factor ChrR (cupin superfamily) [Methylohalomonas lacus]|uniref:Anti-sigma factor ChrR (Cupin superfamily) n=1 Tax=Methylohalomonas lacus TaxID=398773 RepID=A0AAE3HHL4_9GAMM|nr:cupin domain-containing protein [Methylohalomonas lacus]MCS3902045.1 anti-sigma factor ChrR (cupin superfamily) [Methylohalomonas lacus]